jgi:hypothetical protein
MFLYYNIFRSRKILATSILFYFFLEISIYSNSARRYCCTFIILFNVYRQISEYICLKHDIHIYQLAVIIQMYHQSYSLFKRNASSSMISCPLHTFVEDVLIPLGLVF